MAVTKDKNAKENPWYFTIETNENGKRKRIKRRGFKTKKEAEAAQRLLIAQMNAGLNVDASEMLYSDYMKDYLRDKASRVGEATLDVYRSLVEGHILPALGNIPIGKITPRHIQDLYNDLFENEKLADENIQKCHTLINESLRKAEAWKMISYNPAVFVDRPKARKKEMLFWSEEECHKFLQASIEDRYYHVFLLALATGMRQSELLGLRMKDIDFERRTISINQTMDRKKKAKAGTKSKSGDRMIGIDKRTAEAIRKVYRRNLEEKMLDPQLYQDNGLLFCTRFGTPVSHRNISRTFYRLLEKADVKKIRFHDMRHTHVVMLLKGRENNTRIKERLGWSSVKMIDRYAHVMPSMQQETADLFGNVFYGSGAEIGAGKEA